MERRLAAILITDVVGYSRMISSDETGALRRLKALRREVIDPRITAARGRIVKSTGDGVIAEFPSSVWAVTCAVEIQRAAGLHNAALPEGQAMHMRIGINLGDVIAEPDGDLYGDGVNVAARLEPLAEPGGLCISRSVHDQVRDRLPYRFEDKGKLPLKNIARPIGVFALSAAMVQGAVTVEDEPDPIQAAPTTDTPPKPTASSSPPGRGVRWQIWGAGALILSAAGLGLGWWAWPKATLADKTLAVQAGLPAKPLPPLSLVVLPFANLSNDPEQDFFADGLTEDLTTDLSHLAGSFVIARNTAFTYKGKAVDVKQLGRDLGVRYALEGSVRRTGEKVVLNAQLISTETGAHVWADRFEGERTRLGELQAEFVARLARSLDVQLTQAESLRVTRERADNPNAADLAMRGWAVLNRAVGAANTSEAIDLFERALKIDPSDTSAALGLARGLTGRLLSDLSPDKDGDRTRVERLLDSIPEGGQNYMVLYLRGELHRSRRNAQLAALMFEASIKANRNFPLAYVRAGYIRVTLGKGEEAFPFIQQAIRLSPSDPQINNFEYFICHAYAHIGQWQDSVEWCEKSVSHGPQWYTSR
ncbi:adenylate/guanylate cyclase domain-containing protein [Methylobacterium phyllosphaerae]